MAHGPSDPSVTVDHDHVEADITDLGSYITDVTGSPLDELSDVAAHTPTKGHLLVADGTDWEALAVGSDDEVLTADSAEATGVKWAAGGGGGGLTYVWKTADETVNNSNTLQDDDVLKVALEANGVYYVEGVLLVQSAVTADFRWIFQEPSGTTWDLKTIELDTGGGTLSFSDVRESDSFDALPTYGTDRLSILRFYGRVVVGGTAGDWQLQWCQNSAEASDTKLLSGSYLAYKKAA